MSLSLFFLIFRDCFDVCFGENVFDECDYCTGPDTGIGYNQFLDCTGVCDGPFRADSCSICQLPDQNGEIVGHADCNGTCFGSAELDLCGVCYGGSTGIGEDSVLDECGICYGNNTCYGCDGILNSGETIDNCGVCGGNDCGCQKIVSTFPNQGPSSGGTEIVMTGSGFFLNGSSYDPSQVNCNVSTETDGDNSVSAICRFVSQQEEAFGTAYIVNQSTIICLTPEVTHVDDYDFDLSIQIENGQYTSPIPFTFFSYADIEIIARFPSMDSVNFENTVTFIGQNFINNGLQSCLLSDISTCSSTLPTDSYGYYMILAEFVSSSEITCTLPIVNTPCQMSVYLSFDGQVSGIIDYPEPFMEKYTYAFSAPNVTSVHFSDDLTTLLIEFDRSVRISGNQELSCYAVFNEDTLELFSQNALCNWGTIQQNSIHVQLPIDATVEVGSLIGFKNETIITNGASFSFAFSDPLYVATAVPPAVVLEGPNIVQSCGSVTFTAINTYFEGYKSFAYNWRVYTLNASIPGMKEIASYMNNLPVTSSSITLSSGFFQFSTEYIVQIMVTNAVGLTSIRNMELTKEIPASLKVSISSPESQTIYAEQDIMFHATIVNDDCIDFQNINFKWKLNKLVDERRSIYELLNFNELITDNSLLYIPNGLLLPDSFYKISVSVSTSGNSQTDMSTVNVLTRHNKCIAKIHGGNRTITAGQSLLLDGSTSLVATTGSSKYVWQCSIVSSGVPCYNVSIQNVLKPLVLPFEKEIYFSSSDLSVGLEYKFTLMLKQDTCESVASTIITIVPFSNPPAIVEILTPSLNFIPSQKVVVEGLVLPNQPVDLTWECLQLQDHSYIALEANILLSPSQYSAIAESAITKYNDYVIIGQASPVNLIIKPWTLNGSLPYTFQLTARYLDDVITSSITITPDVAPKVHSFSVSPTSGIELDTIFKLHLEHLTENVYDYPIHFQYGVVLGDDYYWLSGLTNERVLDTYLPLGSPTSVVVRVFDKNGGYSETFSEVHVTSSNSFNYVNFVQDVKNNLENNRDWTDALKSFLTMMISISPNDISLQLEDSIVDLFYELFNNYVPFNEANAMAALSTVKQIVNKVPNMSHNNRMTLLSMISNILTAIEELLTSNFGVIQDLSDPIAIQLRSNRFNTSLFIEAIQSETIASAFQSTTILTSDWNPVYATNEILIRQKLHNILCKQTLLGDAPSTLEINEHEFKFLKGIPFGNFESSYSSAFVELNNGFFDIYNGLTCTGLNTACSEACIQLTTSKNDYFAATSDNVVTLSSSVKEKISSNIPGSDTESVQLISEIISFDFSLPTDTEYILVTDNDNAKIAVHIPITTVNPIDSIPICMFRESSNVNGEWEVDTLSPPSIDTINEINYFTCEYNHLSEFAIGLLSPPVIPISSSSVIFSSSIAHVSSSSFVLLPSSSPSPVMSTAVKVPYNAVPAIVGGILPVLLLLLVICIVVIVVFALLWMKKRSGKAKVTPVNDEVGLKVASENSFVSEESVVVSPSPETFKITLGVIQLKENGERTPLGSLDVSKSTRLRELRNLLCDNFPQLRNVSFYLCTKELSDIEPATEQQQFVSIVYGNIAYVREISKINENTMKQFCICKKVAQFECSKCSQRGYCSKECQDKDWETNHKKECSRVVEKRNRTDVLLQRQSSKQTLDEADIASRRQSVTSWSAFINQSKSYQTLTKSPTGTMLPPLTLSPKTKLTTVEESEELLRKQLDSTKQTLVPPAKQISPPTVLPRLASRTSVGQLASHLSFGDVTSPPNNIQTRPMLSPIAPRLSLPTSQRPGVLPSQLSRSSIPGPLLLQPRPSVYEQYSPIQPQSVYEQVYNEQAQLQQQSQLPLFRQIPTTRTVPNHQRISVSSVLSSDGFSPRPTIRQEPVLEESEEDSLSSSSENELDAEDNRVPSSRPPSLAVRRRSSSQLTSGQMEQQSSSDSSDSSSEDES